MAIVEHPLSFLIIALFLLLGMLIFFKLVDFLFANAEKKKKKKESKSTEKKDSKPTEKKEEKVVENKKIEEKPNESQPTQTVESKQGVNTTSNGYNYLHDRFVDNPTTDDVVCNNENYSMFLSNEEYDRIRNEKIEIRVKEDGSLNGKIDTIIKGSNSEKERLLGEFNNLSKEMKLLIIENILKNS